MKNARGSLEIPLYELTTSPDHNLPKTMGSEDNDDDYRDDDNAQTGLLNGKSKDVPYKLREEQETVSQPKTSLISKLVFGFGIAALCFGILAWAKAANLTEVAIADYCAGGSTEPEYFQYTKADFRGPKATGRPPMLSQEDAIVPVDGRKGSLELEAPAEDGYDKSAGNKTIFQKMGYLSPWYKDADGFGVDELPMPSECKVTQAFVLHRHGARYPTISASVVSFGKNLSETLAQGHAEFKDKLSFLHDWSYGLGLEVLVPFGRQQLYESGVSHYYSYGALYNTSTKIVARTTTQDRMVESAENFLAGFFGQRWNQNATLETIIESGTGVFNNSLAGYDNCPNSNRKDLNYGREASEQWQEVYLQDAVKRLQSMSLPSYAWTISKAFAAQSMCPYETVALGYSSFCSLFTREEWDGFEYAIDLKFSGSTMFPSPTGRAVGIGWVQELLARLNHQLITKPTAQDNITLDSNTRSFPLDQSLYFDFTHDSMITAIITALGFKQFAPILPAEGPPDPKRSLIISKIVPFAARLVIEIVKAPRPIKSTRSKALDPFEDGKETQYIHFLLNSRTLPLGESFSECGNRDDGWCELQIFLDIQAKSLERANYEYSCFGDYAGGKYGDVVDGVPVG